MTTALLAAVAVAVGFFIGAVGVGGILLIPALVLLGGLGIHQATATALFSFLFTGLLGTWLFQRRGSIDWKMTVPVCAGAVVFSYLGAMVNSMVGARLLALIIALTIVFAGAYVLLPARGGAGRIRDGKSMPQQLLLLAVGAGIGLMLALDKALPHAHAVSGVHGPATHASRGLLLALALFLHNFPEGMAVGIAASGGEGAVVPVALAIAVQDVPEGLLVALALGAAGMNLQRAVLLGAATGLAEPVGAWIAATVLGDNPALYPLGLAFAAGAMGFVVFHEMLPELKSRGGLPQVSGALAGGIALMLGVDLFLG